MRYSAVIVIIVVVALAYLFLVPASGPAQLEEFAKCLAGKGVSLAGTSTCHYCNEQKTMFGDSFSYIEFHDCGTDPVWCAGNNVRSYPTWVFADGRRAVGLQSLKRLSELSGCTL